MKLKAPRLFTTHNGDLRSRSNLNISITSLMWPTGRSAEHTLSVSWDGDLGLSELVSALSTDKRYRPYIRQMLAALITDTDVIAWRQAVMADFVANPALVQRVAALLPRLADLREGRIVMGQHNRNLLLETADRLAELDLYTDVVRGLHEALSAVTLESAALINLRDSLKRLLDDESFQALCLELPELRTPLENIVSMTVGINLDMDLQPISAVLMSINDTPMGEPNSLLERLLGARTEENEETGIAPLHGVPRDPDQRPLAPLFQDMDRLLTQVAQPVARALNRYVRTGTGSLAGLEFELAFFVTAAQMVMRLREQHGVSFCRPDIAPMEERVLLAEGLVNINLALRQPAALVPSDADFGADGRIAVLTGPNSGGKTTYLRSVGLAYVLFQAGLFVPARQARMSPVDAIFTHFPALENRQQGRLAEEASRLRDLFRQVTPHSLVLLNETFSSTASGEALYLAQDILGGLRAIGVRAIYATHLTELAGRLPEIEAAVEGPSGLFCLVAGIELDASGQAVPTFQITRGLPLGRSFAHEIARRHGISLEQILAAQRNGASGHDV